jgi:NAD-dependent SIR2 family protein deacetylase
MDEIQCPNCRQCTDLVDSTISPSKEHNGDIYYCEECETYWLHDFARERIVEWDY